MTWLQRLARRFCGHDLEPHLYERRERALKRLRKIQRKINRGARQ